MPPTTLVEYLGEYLETMTTTLQAHQGAVDKFIGDGILAIFNAPLTLPRSMPERRATRRSQHKPSSMI